jgi:hypothetical protein
MQKSNNRPVLRRFYDYFNRKWFITTLIVTSAGQWFLILKCFGTSLKTVDVNGNFTPRFYYLFWPVFITAFLFSLLKAWADNYSQKNKNNGRLVLDQMLQSITSAKASKFRRFVDFIESNHNKCVTNPFNIITQPKQQIETILTNIQITLSNIFDIERSNIGLSIIYSVDNEKWDWLYTMSVSEDTTLNELLNNDNSAVRQIIDHKVSYLFYPDKRIGIRENKYFPGKSDKNFGNIGSILCSEISVGLENKYLRAILSITTYGTQLCSEKDENSKEKLKSTLLPNFEQRIKVELALLYIKDVIAVPRSFTAISNK